MSNPEWFTGHELAEYLGMTERAVRKWRQHGKGPPYCKLEGSVRYRKADVDAWIDACVVTGDKGTFAAEGS